MTTESTEPQAELEPTQANGQGTSQGHRRRRRRRKNKTSASAPQQQGQLAVVQQQAPPPPSQAPVQQRPPQRSAAPPQNQSRKKKKTFQKSTLPAPGPGNSISAPSQSKRKPAGGRQQRGPREFVGPMDHSYRVANGNVADGPPSTVMISSGGHGGHFQDNFAPQPTIAVREGAITRIFCFIEDLFFMAKIQETARKLGIKVEFVKGDKETLTRLTELPEEERPTLLVFDMNNVNAKAMTMIPKFKAKLKKATSIIGFLNHLQGDLKMKALDAGCDTVMPRSAFSQTLPNLLRRYGIEEEEEYYPQPM
jgi:hypothetical protein